MHAGSQMSTPLIHCRTDDVVMQVAPLSRSFKWLTSRILVLIGNVGDGNFRPSFYKKQYLSNGQASCREIFTQTLQIDGFSSYKEKYWLSFSIHKVIMTRLWGPFFSGHGV